MIDNTPNSIFQLAADCINFSNRSVFLTGKAGTGKTTFLKHIKESSAKQTAVLAPTGVAAINGGGVTIHSFFQLPFAPFIPESGAFKIIQNDASNRHSLLSHMRLNKERIKVLQQLELLIIDEISMVRCDVLDSIDTVLRHFRNRNSEPFGGVQMLFIGDMYQLPPVAINEEWQILSQYYNSPYFFDSIAIKQYPPLYIELEKIYRQSDPHFIMLLNAIRNNAMTEETFRLLHSRYQPQFAMTKEQRYITLTTHNFKADNLNSTELQQLAGTLFKYKAVIEGEFSEKAYPADVLLQLKIHAQVMFIKNDTEKERRYFNGKIGTVTKIEEGKIFVKCGIEEPVEVKQETWKNIRYTLNANTQKVEEEEIGSFTQYPLRLAWAITIHKSQGLTFENAVIDAGAAFAPGQVYVALSRCTSLEGLVLQSRITPKSLFSDERINTFAAQKTTGQQLPEKLLEAKHTYQQLVLTDLFNFTEPLNKSIQLTISTEENITAFNEATMPWLNQIAERLPALQTIAEKFTPELALLLKEPQLPEENEALQKRIKAAAAYFIKELQHLLDYITQSPAATDSRQYALAYNEDLASLHTAIAFKQHLLNACSDGFTAANFRQQKNMFTVPALRVNAYGKISSNTLKDSPHPALLKQLRILRDALCVKEDLPIYVVAGSTTLDEMVKYLPQSIEELVQISGFGKAKIEKYGQQFIDIIKSYSVQNNLSSKAHEKLPKKKYKKMESKKSG